MRPRKAPTELGCFVALGAAVLAVGGGTRWGQAIVAGVVAVALALTVGSRRRFARTSPLVAVLGIAAVLTALQLIPLPAALLATFNQTGSTLRDEGAALAGVNPGNALSMDTPGSLQALVGFVILLGVATLGLRVSVSDRGRFKLVAAVGAVCALAAVITGLHALLGETSLYGLYVVKHHPRLIGPLLNLNHLGCLMAIGTVVSIGLAAYGQQPTWMRASWFATAAGCGGLAVYTVSRGATLAMIAGALVTIALVIAQRFANPSERRERGRFLTSSLPIAVLAVCVIVVVIYSSASSVEQKLETTTLQELHEPSSKFSAWRSAAHAVQEAPVLGIGRGAFEPYFTRLHPTSGQLVFSHVENEYLQTLVDWGIVGALLLGIAGIWLAVRAIARWRDGPLSAAALGGLVVLAVQSIVDFGGQVLGIAVPALLLACTLVYVPLKEVSGRNLVRSRALRAAHAVALLVGVALLLSRMTTTISEDHEELGSIESRDLSSTEARIQAAIARHPLDYYGYAVAAELSFRRNDANGVRLLNHALRLNPSHGGLHRVAARRLRRGNHLQQAAIEYGEALRFSDSAMLLDEIASALPVELAATAIPIDMPRPEIVVAALRAAHHDALATAWLGRIVSRHPSDAHACDMLVRRVREEGDGAAANIAKRGCASALSDAGARLALGRVLLRDGHLADVVEVMKDIEHASGSSEEKHIAWRFLCEAHRAAKNLDAASACFRRLKESPELPGNQREAVNGLLTLVEQERKAASAP